MAFGGFFGGGSSSSSDSSKDTDSSSSSGSGVPGLSNPVFSGTSSSGTGSSAIKARLVNAITTESNIINAKFLIQKINENCFDHCITDPGSSLSSKENTCLSTCMEKYIEAWNTTSKTYVGRLQREGASLGGMVGAGAGAAPTGKELF